MTWHHVAALCLVVQLVLGTIFFIVKYPGIGEHLGIMVLSQVLTLSTAIATGAFGNAGTQRLPLAPRKDPKPGDSGSFKMVEHKE
jgi:hypothetical protein